VDLGRQILCESSRTDENRNSARAVSIASSTGLRSTSGASGGILPKRAYKIVVDGMKSHPFHLEIEDDWLLVHQETDLKRPSLASFSRKMGQGKGSEQFIGF
jgi:hypothetical protein